MSFQGGGTKGSQVVLKEREGIDLGDKGVDTYSNNCGVKNSWIESIPSDGGKVMDKTKPSL